MKPLPVAETAKDMNGDVNMKDESKPNWGGNQVKQEGSFGGAQNWGDNKQENWGGLGWGEQYSPAPASAYHTAAPPPYIPNIPSLPSCSLSHSSG